MALNETPNRLESVFIQRDPTNAYYEQINISGSDLMIYHKEDGTLTADKVSVWVSKYGIGGSGVTPGGSYDISASWASRSLWSIYADSSSWSSESLSSSHVYFNGNRTIKRSPYTTLNVGGSTVSEFLENFFFPFIPATVSITNAATYYYETGSTQDFRITSSITANDETTFGTASIRRSGVVWQTVSPIPPLTFRYVDTNVSTSYSYITYVQTDNNGTPTVINSSVRSINFIYPYLWGTSDTPGLSENALYTTLNKLIEVSGSKTVSIVGTNVYIYFCYPSTYTPLNSILDPNSFEIKSSFEYSASVPITSSGLTNNWQTTYKVYRTKLIADMNGNFQFK